MRMMTSAVLWRRAVLALMVALGTAPPAAGKNNTPRSEANASVSIARGYDAAREIREIFERALKNRSVRPFVVETAGNKFVVVLTGQVGPGEKAAAVTDAENIKGKIGLSIDIIDALGTSDAAETSARDRIAALAEIIVSSRLSGDVDPVTVRVERIPDNSKMGARYVVLLTGRVQKETKVLITSELLDNVRKNLNDALGGSDALSITKVLDATTLFTPPTAATPEAPFTTVWPLTFLRGTAPKPSAVGTSATITAATDGTQATVDSITAVLQGLVGDGAKITAQSHRLFITGKRAKVQEIRRHLAQSIDIPFSQVRMDFWTIQANTKSTRPGRKERAQDNMASIRTGIQMSRDLMERLRQGIIQFVRDEEGPGIEANIRDSDYQTHLAQNNTPVPLRDILEYAGFDSNIRRPLTLAEAITFLAFADVTGGDTPFSPADIDGPAMVRALKESLKNQSSDPIGAYIKSCSSLMDELNKYTEKRGPTPELMHAIADMLNDYRQRETCIADISNSAFARATSGSDSLNDLVKAAKAEPQEIEKKRLIRKVNKLLIQAAYPTQVRALLGDRMRRYLTFLMKDYVAHASQEARFTKMKDVQELLKRFARIAEAKEQSGAAGGGVFPRFVQAYSYTSRFDRRQTADVQGIGDFMKYWALADPRLATTKKLVISDAPDAGKNPNDFEDVPGKLARYSAEVDGMLKSIMGNLTADMQELCTQPLLDWIRADIQKGSEGSSGIQVVGNSSLVVSSRQPADMTALAESYFPFTPRPKLTEDMLTSALTLSKGTSTAVSGERVVTEKDGTIVRKKNGDVLKLTATQDVARDAAGSVLRDQTSGDPVLLTVPAPTISSPLTVLGALSPLEALGVKMLFNETETVYNKVSPGISIGVRPTVLRDGGSARLLINLLTGASVDENQATPARVQTNGPPVDLIRGHNLETDVAVQATDLFELSTFATETTRPGEPQWRIPLLEQLPVIGRLFNGPPKHETHHQESLIIVYVTILPRSLDLAGRFLR